MGVDPCDFNTHAFDPWRVDIEALQQFYARSPRCRAHATAAKQPCITCAHAGGSPVNAFLALREAGFEFFFMPNV